MGNDLYLFFYQGLIALTIYDLAALGLVLLEVKRSRYGISVRLGSKSTDFEFLELALVLSSGEEEEEEESEFLLLPEEDDRYAFSHAPSISAKREKCVP